MAENFDLIFGSSASQSYSWNDSDYQNGWQTVGDTPPTREQFDALQRRADLKAQELNNRLAPIEKNDTHDYRQPNTTYTAGQIKYHATLPTGWYLECTTAGVTGSGALTITSPTVGGTVSDGTVTWTVNRDLPLIGGGALTGTNLTWNGDDLGGSAIVAKSLGTNGYIKYASGLIMQWGALVVNGVSSVLYPISFLHEGQVVTTPVNSTQNVYTTINSTSLSGCTIKHSLGAQDIWCNWCAIGY